VLRQGPGDRHGEVLLNASCASGSVRVLRAHREAAKPECGQRLAHCALVHRHAEARLDPVLQVHAPQAAPPRPRRGRAPPAPFAQAPPSARNSTAAEARPSGGSTDPPARRRCSDGPGRARSAGPSRNSRLRSCGPSPPSPAQSPACAAPPSHPSSSPPKPEARRSRAESSLRVIATAIRPSMLRCQGITPPSRRHSCTSQ
jgi:hypothetical protein